MEVVKIQIKDNSEEVKKAAEQQILRGLEECGLLAEGYAKQNITQQGAVDTGNLRNSITHKVQRDEKACYIGTNVEYAPYIELGTGQYYAGGRQTPWVYQDQSGEFHKTTGMKPRPYLKPAITDHANDYKRTLENALKN